MTQPLKRLVSSTVEQSTYVGVSVTLSNMIHMPGKLANTMCFSHLFIQRLQSILHLIQVPQLAGFGATCFVHRERRSVHRSLHPGSLRNSFLTCVKTFQFFLPTVQRLGICCTSMDVQCMQEFKILKLLGILLIVGEKVDKSERKMDRTVVARECRCTALHSRSAK